MSRSGSSHERPKGYGRGVVLILLAGLVWSTMGLGVRMIEHASAIQILFYRSLGVLPVLLLFITISSGFHPIRVFARTGAASIIGGLFLIIAFFGGVISLTETTVANAVFLFSISPLLSALLGYLVLGERIRLATWVTMAVAGVGVAIMVVEGLSVGRMFGNVAALVSAAGFAVFTLCLRWEKSGDSMPAALLGGLYATIATAVAIPIAGQSHLLSFWDTSVALVLGMVGLSGGLILYTIGTRTVAAGEASLLTLLEVLLSPLWVYLLFDEKAGFYTLVGGAILLTALVGNAISGVFGQQRTAGLIDPAKQQEFDDGPFAGDHHLANGPYDETDLVEYVIDDAPLPPVRPLQPLRPPIRPARIQRG